MDFLKVSYSLPSALPSVEGGFLLKDKSSSVVTIPTHLYKEPKGWTLLAASYSLFSGPLQELGYLINVKKKA